MQADKKLRRYIVKKILVTGGTVFVSRYIAEYYTAKGYDVYVINRNSRKQSAGVTLIEADRHNLGEILRDYCFDVVIDTAYSSTDVKNVIRCFGRFQRVYFNQFKCSIS